jgi:hypothetical protein
MRRSSSGLEFQRVAQEHRRVGFVIATEQQSTGSGTDMSNDNARDHDRAKIKELFSTRTSDNRKVAL